MNPTPAGWPRMSQSIYYQDPAAAIDWLCRAFGFEIHLKVEDDAGGIVHSELTFGDGMIMVGDAKKAPGEGARVNRASPRMVDGRNTMNMMVYVDDVEAHCRRARAKGAVIVSEPATHDYGDDYWADRSYGAIDPEGHLWWFSQRIRGA